MFDLIGKIIIPIFTLENPLIWIYAKGLPYSFQGHVYEKNAALHFMIHLMKHTGVMLMKKYNIVFKQFYTPQGTKIPLVSS